MALIDQVKGYLGITKVAYDAQITTIVTLREASIDSKINSSDLANPAYEADITLGKVLMISGYVVQALPPETTHLVLGKTEVSRGDQKDVIDNTSIAAYNIIEEGKKTLAPYLKPGGFDGELQVKSNLDDVTLEFTLTRGETTGSMEDW